MLATGQPSCIGQRFDNPFGEDDASVCFTQKQAPWRVFFKNRLYRCSRNLPSSAYSSEDYYPFRGRLPLYRIEVTQAFCLITSQGMCVNRYCLLYYMGMIQYLRMSTHINKLISLASLHFMSP